MGKSVEQFEVKVMAGSAEEGRRKIVVEVDAKNELFYLTDALSKEGRPRELSQELRVVVKNGVLNYVEGSKQWLRQVGAAEKGRKKEGKLGKRENQ